MNDLRVTEYKDIRVLTTQQISDAYGTDNKTISYNFNHNKERYKEGKHYICLVGEELKAFREIHELPTNVSKLYLWTEKGAFLHAKSLGTDKAWEVYEILVDSYFAKQKVLSLPEQIQLLAKGSVELDQKIDSVNKDLQDFKQDMPLLAVECERITKAVKTKGISVLGGRDSEAYNDKSLRSKVYSDIHGEVRRQFGVNTYKAIKRSECDKVVEVINSYHPPMVIAQEIKDVNAQIRF